MNDSFTMEMDQCEHEYLGWMRIGLNSDGSECLYTRKCIKCNHSEKEWREEN